MMEYCIIDLGRETAEEEASETVMLSNPISADENAKT